MRRSAGTSPLAAAISESEGVTQIWAEKSDLISMALHLLPGKVAKNRNLIKFIIY